MSGQGGLQFDASSINMATLRYQPVIDLSLFNRHYVDLDRVLVVVVDSLLIFTNCEESKWHFAHALTIIKHNI